MQGIFLSYRQHAEKNRQYWKLVSTNKCKCVLAYVWSSISKLSTWTADVWVHTNTLQRAFHKHYVTKLESRLASESLAIAAQASYMISEISSQPKEQFQIKAVKTIPTKEVIPASISNSPICSLFCDVNFCFNYLFPLCSTFNNEVWFGTTEANSRRVTVKHSLFIST